MTFICNFSDGEQTRMSVYCHNGPDLERGLKLARYAYESRKGTTAPTIASASFVSRDGKTVATYAGNELAEAA